MYTVRVVFMMLPYQLNCSTFIHHSTSLTLFLVNFLVLVILPCLCCVNTHKSDQCRSFKKQSQSNASRAVGEGLIIITLS